MKVFDIVSISILSVLTVFAIIGIIIVFKEPKTIEVKVTNEIKMTAEQMANRPIAEKQEQPQDEKVEVIEEKEIIIPKDYFLYDIVPLTCEEQLLTQELCEQYHVGYAFFLAMLESESSFCKDAQGDSGRSIGYMQINKPNWDRYGLNAFVPDENLEIGIRMMGELIERYEEFDMVVMCYKAGEGKANELREQGIRLSVCDEVAGNTIWWEQRLNECKGID